jgi:hypothetical protein
MGRLLHNVILKGSGLARKADSATRPVKPISLLSSEYARHDSDTNTGVEPDPKVLASPLPRARGTVKSSFAISEKTHPALLAGTSDSVFPGQPRAAEEALSGNELAHDRGSRPDPIAEKPAHRTLVAAPHAAQQPVLPLSAEETRVEAPSEPSSVLQTITPRRPIETPRNTLSLDALRELEPGPASFFRDNAQQAARHSGSVEMPQAAIVPAASRAPESTADDEERVAAEKDMLLVSAVSPALRSPGRTMATKNSAAEAHVHVRIGRVEVRMQQPQALRAAERKPRSGGFSAYARVRSYLE